MPLADDALSSKFSVMFSMFDLRFSMARGVNGLETSERRRVWSGGSWFEHAQTRPSKEWSRTARNTAGNRFSRASMSGRFTIWGLLKMLATSS